MHFVICSLKYVFSVHCIKVRLRSEIVEYTGNIWYMIHSKCQTIFVQQFYVLSNTLALKNYAFAYCEDQDKMSLWRHFIRAALFIVIA